MQASETHLLPDQLPPARLTQGPGVGGHRPGLQVSVSCRVPVPELGRAVLRRLPLWSHTAPCQAPCPAAAPRCGMSRCREEKAGDNGATTVRGLQLGTPQGHTDSSQFASSPGTFAEPDTLSTAWTAEHSRGATSQLGPPSTCSVQLRRDHHTCASA